MAKFKYEGEEPVTVYGGHKVKNGDVIELDEHFSEKARNNPSCGLVEVKEGARVTAQSDEEIAAAEAARVEKERVAEEARAAKEAKKR